MSQDTVRVRVTRGDYRHDREHYTRGEELEVPQKVLEQHPNSLTRIDDPETPPSEMSSSDNDADDGDAAAGLDVDDLDPHPDDLTVDDLKERIGDVDDVELLETILDAEGADGSPRSTAVDAIEGRISELEG
ncbi:hypothetical protein [Halobacterium hubeiense]|uniref:hypothetical protein n=1 Tax=Halobacterium hubeiense TaxID=1407499 RepID=UPI000B7D8889|nr:hypothetical protein [Halobacterium hubeiense]